MAYRNLDEYLTRLEQAGEVSRRSIDSHIPNLLEMPSNDTKAKIYEDASSRTRIVQNLFGTQKRIELALRVDSLKEMTDRLAVLIEFGRPGAFSVMMSQAVTLFSVLRTNTNRRAAKEFLPFALSSWLDGLPVALKSDPPASIQATLLTGEPHSIMRQVVFKLSSDGIRIESAATLPVGEAVALVVGCDPAYMLASMMPIPNVFHRSYFASWLRQRPLEVMRLSGIDFDVPINAETIISGRVSEVSASTYNSYFDFDHSCLQLNADAIWTRPGAIYTLWTHQDFESVKNALRILSEPLIRKLLPPNADIEQFILYLKRTWLDDITA